MLSNGFLDAAERVFWTAVVAFGTPLLASPVFDNFGVGWEDALKISAFAAAGTLLKAVVALGINRTNGAQLGVDSVVLKPDADGVRNVGG